MTSNSYNKNSKFKGEIMSLVLDQFIWFAFDISTWKHPVSSTDRSEFPVFGPAGLLHLGYEWNHEQII